jgi:phosphotransferase system HPr (HPr) family protein
MNTKKCDGPVVERELWVENRLGIHARPAMKITNLALEKDSVAVSARDLLAILTLDCPQGTRLVLKASGSDASEAALAVCQLFARKFGET